MPGLNPWTSALKYATAALLLSFVVLSAIYSVWFFDIHPEFKAFNNPEVDKVSIRGANFEAVVGKSFSEKGSSIVSGFSRGRAILSTSARFYAEDFPFMEFQIDGLDSYTKTVVIWRNAKNPGLVYSLPLNKPKSGTAQVAMLYGSPNYAGEITEVGVGFVKDSSKAPSKPGTAEARIQQLELRPFSTQHLLEQLWSDLVNPPLWPGYANNVVRGVHQTGVLFPNLAINLAGAISILLLLAARLVPKLYQQRSFSLTRAVFLVLCVCWITGDALRWQTRLAMASDSYNRYAWKRIEERILNNDIRCERFPQDCRADLLPYF